MRDFQAGFVAYNGIVLKDGLQGYNRHQWDVSLAAAMDINKVYSSISAKFCDLLTQMN